MSGQDAEKEEKEEEYEDEKHGKKEAGRRETLPGEEEKEEEEERGRGNRKRSVAAAVVEEGVAARGSSCRTEPPTLSHFAQVLPLPAPPGIALQCAAGREGGTAPVIVVCEVEMFVLNNPLSKMKLSSHEWW
ncbi:hypothetical protein E2C01_036730 [Portunus trituberculatus]|uniref:Uncharacterized protein n=1 Tax=Portunus trituberculatus TaxID=210409 RepID=A0A5B7FD89_PORTR|nr:hypothetical protein [Portunus trituberculatus]